ncbi:MAG: LptF/LptG family permease [Planctomycetota bacterium]
MKIVDRYVLGLFFSTFLICFSSFAGLFVVVHLFSNLDELSALAQKEGWSQIMTDFYLPRVAEIFDKTIAILILASAIFSVNLLNRRREFTALESSGITKSRMLRPIFVFAILLIGVSILNRELLIPVYKSQLVRTAQTWGDHGNVDMRVQEDLKAGVIVRGDELILDDKKIASPDFQLTLSEDNILKASSEWAILEPESPNHPPGFRLCQVTQPIGFAEMDSILSDSGHPRLMTPKDNPSWLGKRQLFIVCDFELEQMAYGTKLADYLSTPELVREVQKPRKWFGRDHELIVHCRMVRPLLDFCLLCLGLPMVIGTIRNNVFVSFGICFWIVAIFQFSQMACGFLGSSGMLTPAALAAWLPLIVFAPLAFVVMGKLKR